MAAASRALLTCSIAPAYGSLVRSGEVRHRHVWVALSRILQDRCCPKNAARLWCACIWRRSCIHARQAGAWRRLCILQALRVPRIPASVFIKILQASVSSPTTPSKELYSHFHCPAPVLPVFELEYRQKHLEIPARHCHHGGHSRRHCHQ